MPAISKTLLDRLETLRKSKGEQQIDIGDIRHIINSLAESLDSGNNVDSQIITEIKEISNEIHTLYADLAKDSAHCDIPSATEELNAVTKATEKAADQIMDAAEQIQAIANDAITDAAIKEQINSKVTDIFESCNFQDLTGQRITKVMTALSHIEGHIENLMKLFPEAQNGKVKGLPSRDKEGLMNGPQLEENTPSQDDIDDLFNNC